MDCEECCEDVLRFVLVLRGPFRPGVDLLKCELADGTVPVVDGELVANIGRDEVVEPKDPGDLAGPGGGMEHAMQDGEGWRRDAALQVAEGF